MTQRAYVDPDTGLAVLTKQPLETKVFRIDFGNMLRGELLSSVSSVTATAQGKVAGAAAITPSSLSVSGRFVLFTMTGGTDGEHYKVTATVVSTSGQTLEADGMLYVSDS